MRTGFVLGILVIAGGIACSLPGSTQDEDWSNILQLEAQAKAIVKTTGCSSVNQCKTAPVGSRACGGPRYYLTYCAATTDSAALYKKLDEISAAEKAYNQKYSIISTCEFRSPPVPTLVNGACTGN
jgi:hypothetical protein